MVLKREDYMTLVRVYFQASMAANLGITNLAMLPDLRTFKATLHVPTVNNKLGLGEKAHCRKMMKQLYGTDDIFFKEIDAEVAECAVCCCHFEWLIVIRLILVPLLSREDSFVGAFCSLVPFADST